MNEEDFKFEFEKLEVYQLALEFLDFIFEICKEIPTDLLFCLGDNLKRAGLSISNNIAEGSGKKSGTEPIAHLFGSFYSFIKVYGSLDFVNHWV